MMFLRIGAVLFSDMRVLCTWSSLVLRWRFNVTIEFAFESYDRR